MVTGSVTQAGQPRGGATVTVLGGSVKSKLTTRKRVRVSASGKFTAKFAVGTFFRADAGSDGRSRSVALHAAAAGHRPGAVRQPDRERLLGQEQGRSQEVATRS